MKTKTVGGAVAPPVP